MSPKVPALFLTLVLVGALPVLSQGSDAPVDPIEAPIEPVLRLGADPLAIHELHEQAESGGLPLVLDGQQAALRLEPNDLVAADAPVLQDGLPVAAPDVALYRGSVIGDTESHARLSISAEVADGYVYAFDTMYDLHTVDGSAVLVRADTLDARPTIIDYEASELATLAPLGQKQGITGCLGATPEVTTSPLGFVSGWDDITYDIVAVSDKGYTERYSDWASAQLAHMNRIDGYYENNFNIRIQVVAQSADTAGTVYTSSSSGGLLSQVRNAWASNSIDRDTVQLLSDKDFDGSVVGQAWCIGGAHSKLLHYTVTQTLGFSEFGASEITAHELGHMMSAHHHYSNCHDTAPSLSTQACTVMIPDAGLINNALKFSMLSRSTIRQYGENVL